ncbi:hypothetical protein Lbir_0500 [Legionella birminghamensis]|uniref:Uncharacterized protein n=1 Tax=Legionella birminghamensis TaxID=28083 RepID=A0A378IDN0_9GAMM|nr:hypothetical protein [Legionella birminghamensis]KTC75355.1 hypothetical protein Lbir_0500 [Legionella birminghamensis]STX33123.1 Uncharacterised protein [Legionella birminghamensis]
MPRKKDTPDKKIRQVVIAPAAQLSAEEQARLQQLMNERQALSDQLAVISSEAFNIAPRLYEASSSLNEFNTILSNSAKNNKRLQLQMERLESNQLTGEDQAEFISLIEKQQQQLLSDKSALLDQFQTRPETLDKEGVASFEEKISFLEQTIISVRNNTVSTQQRQQIALLLFPIQNRLLQQAISDIQPPFNHLKSLEKIPATVIIRTAHELYAQVKTHIEQLRNRVGESTASSDLKRTIQETDNAILQFEQAMTQFLKAQERIQTSEKAGNDDHIRLANIHWQLQQKSFEIRQGIKLIDDKLILENKDAAISKAQGLANTKQRQLRQTLNIIQLYPIRSQFIQEIKHLLANFENSEEIITLDVQLTSSDELQWHNRSELVPGLLIQRDTQLTVLQQQLEKFDQALSNVAQAIETEKQRLLPFQNHFTRALQNKLCSSSWVYSRNEKVCCAALI